MNTNSLSVLDDADIDYSYDGQTDTVIIPLTFSADLAADWAEGVLLDGILLRIARSGDEQTILAMKIAKKGEKD